MTAEELMTIANMGKGTDMSSYEHFMMAEKSARRPSGVGIAGLAIGSTALLAAVGAWIFGGVYANSQSKGNQRAIDILATTALTDANITDLSEWTQKRGTFSSSSSKKPIKFTNESIVQANKKVLSASTNFSPVSNSLFGIYTNVEFLTCQVSVL